jgi:hypothetical protein
LKIVVQVRNAIAGREDGLHLGLLAGLTIEEQMSDSIAKKSRWFARDYPE